MKVYFEQSVVPESNGLVEIVRSDSGWKCGDIAVLPSPEMVALGRQSYKVIMDAPDSGRVVRFADLHRHSDNSLLDGMTKVSEMAKATEYAGALTDHGNMYGFLEFYTEMTKAGKKAIIGMEAYTDGLDGELEGYHLVLLAKNDIGYRNLIALASESYDHFYRHPHVTWEMLEKYHEGLIATAACIGGVVQSYLLAKNEEKARKALERYISIFGSDDFFLEVQRHGISEEGAVEMYFCDFAAEYGLKIIATTDSHYPKQEDAYAHEVMLCMQRRARMDEDHWKFDGHGYHLHTSEEMEKLFIDHPEWLDNTLELAEKCTAVVPTGNVNLPNYEIPAEFSSQDDYFEHLCREGFESRFAGTEHLKEEKYLERFDYEMSIIKSMGFSGYFLIVWDYINWARRNDIYVGPGRGSAAGSLLAYCLGITDLDPIKYDLLFERFLNPERVSMPD